MTRRLDFQQPASLPTLRRSYQLVWRLFHGNVALADTALKRSVRLAPPEDDRLRLSEGTHRLPGQL